MVALIRAAAPGILWAAPDHASLVAAAVDVAAADGLTYMGRLLAGAEARGRPALMARLRQGAIDADYPASGGYVLHLYHFHHPWTHDGYAGSCVSAAQAADTLFGDALDLWQTGRRGEAIYELGRACHLFADCWIPYHAACVATCGHGQYEAWLAENGRWRDWVPGNGGRYQWHAVYRRHVAGPAHALDWRSPPHWVDLAAHESWPWYAGRLNGCARGIRGPRPHVAPFFPAAAAALVPGAVRYAAGFLHYFFTLAGEEAAAATPAGAAPSGGAASTTTAPPASTGEEG